MKNQNRERIFLVTGASGYVGGRLVRDLLSDGKKVRIFVRVARRLLVRAGQRALKSSREMQITRRI